MRAMLGLLVTVLALVAGVGRAAKANTVRVTVLNEVRTGKAMIAAPPNEVTPKYHEKYAVQIKLLPTPTQRCR